MKIAFLASSGGHLEEISCLYPIAKKYDSFLVTEEGGQEQTLWGDKCIKVPQINRKQKDFIPAFIKLFLKARKILKKGKTRCCNFNRCPNDLSFLCGGKKTWSKGNLY